MPNTHVLCSAVYLIKLADVAPACDACLQHAMVQGERADFCNQRDCIKTEGATRPAAGGAEGATSTATFSTGTLLQPDLSSETQSDGNRKRQRTRARRVELSPVAALAEHPRLPPRTPLTPPLAHLLHPRPPSFPPPAHLLGPRPPVTPPMADLLGPIQSPTPALAHLLGLKALVTPPRARILVLRPKSLARRPHWL